MTDRIGTRSAKTPEIVELVERPAAVVHVDATISSLTSPAAP